ncbi:hypothetical protein COPCOM_02900 [Coprococcus comes ATCC 27758]|uniref:Uncharacterized protein n=1 Tax=Coprococcus comes ATCC 27758 TaxID=470146 RepID=C0BCK9_9FIRM|nr:hypothetical protein COPCOM_02900 [Coprococcus comes ATCC 27758]
MLKDTKITGNQRFLELLINDSNKYKKLIEKSNLQRKKHFGSIFEELLTRGYTDRTT